MSDRLEGALGAAFIALGAVVYMGCGAILARLIGINENALAWWAMVAAWPLVLFILALVGWAMFAMAYAVVAILASAASRR